VNLGEKYRTYLVAGLDMELGNAWPTVLSRGVESVAQAGLETRAQFARLEKKVRIGCYYIFCAVAHDHGHGMNALFCVWKRSFSCV